MVDTKLVVNQLERLQVLFSDLLSEELVINEPFQVATMIEKLPSSWKDFKNYLKHKQKELSMEDLAVKLRIEEDNRNGDKVPLRLEARANVVETSKPQPKKHQGKKKNGNMGPKNKTLTKHIQRSCWVCGKTGHGAIDYRQKKGQSTCNNQCKNNQANMMEEDVDLIAVVTNVCMVSNAKG